MTTPAEVEDAIEAALARIAAELKAVAETLAKLEALMQFIASAAGVE